MKPENNENCKIVQDLMPSYLENLLSDESKVFVDKHISTCNNCKEYLNVISENISNEKLEQDEVNKIEIDSLRKYRTRLSILKKILLIILITIIIIIIAVFSRCIYYDKILTNSQEKIGELKDSENFHITRKSIDIEYKDNTINEYTDEIYYKDGKYKRVGDYYITYGQVDSTKCLEILHDPKTIQEVDSNYVPYTKKELVSLYSHINIYEGAKSNLIKFHLLINIISIREAKYNDRECYVIRTGSSDSGYNEFWLDKQSNLMFRYVSEHYGLYYREYIYTLDFNQTRDEDVEIDNLEKYSDYTRKDNIKVTYSDEFQEMREKFND